MSAQASSAAERAAAADPPVPATGPTRRRPPAADRMLPVACALVPGILVVVLAFQSGGYFPLAPATVALVLCGLLLAHVALHPRPLAGAGPAVAIAAGALAAFAGWQLLSGDWSGAHGRALTEAGRTVLYLLALLLSGIVARDQSRPAWMARGLLGGIAVVCVAGLITRIAPDLWPAPANIASQRLSYPVSYWNTLGLLATLGILLALGLSSSPRERRAVRVLAAAVVPALACTLLLTFSRGAIGGLAVGLLVLIVAGVARGLPAALLAIMPPTVVAVVVAYDADLLATPDPTTPAAIAQGHHLARVVILCVLAAGALRWLMTVARGRYLTLDSSLRLWPRAVPAVSARRRAVLAVLAVAILAAIALGGIGAVSHQYHRFASTSGSQHEQTRDRLTDPGNNGRIDFWHVSHEAFAADPLHGSGAGTFEHLWARLRPVRAQAVDAHSLYAETAAELGVVGSLLLGIVLAMLLGGLAVRVRSSNRQAGLDRHRDRAIAASVLAAAITWALVAGIDWVWEMPVATIWLFAAGGAALARRDGTAAGQLPGGSGPLLRVAAALACLALAVVPMLVAASQARLDAASDAAQNGDCRTTRDAAQQSLSIVGARPEPYAIIGSCDLAQARSAVLRPVADARAQRAASAFRAAAARDPADWRYRYELAVALAAAGRNPHGAARAAHTRNPLEPLTAIFERSDPGGPASWRAIARRAPDVVVR